MNSTSLWNIDTLSQYTFVSKRTIHEWSSKGLLPSPLRRGRSFLYGTEHYYSVLAIALLRRAGVPLGDIRLLLPAVREHQPEFRVHLDRWRELQGRIDELNRELGQTRGSREAPGLDTDLALVQRSDPLQATEELKSKQELRGQLISDATALAHGFLKLLHDHASGPADAGTTGCQPSSLDSAPRGFEDRVAERVILYWLAITGNARESNMTSGISNLSLSVLVQLLEGAEQLVSVLRIAVRAKEGLRVDENPDSNR